MFNYLNNLWHGKLPFWHVFWVWGVLANCIWMGLTIDYAFIGSGIAKFVLKPILYVFPGAIVLFPIGLYFTLTPIILIAVFRSGSQSTLARLTSIFLWAIYAGGLLFITFTLVLGCRLGQAGSSNARCFGVF